MAYGWELWELIFSHKFVANNGRGLGLAVGVDESKLSSVGNMVKRGRFESGARDESARVKGSAKMMSRMKISNVNSRTEATVLILERSEGIARTEDQIHDPFREGLRAKRSRSESGLNPGNVSWQEGAEVSAPHQRRENRDFDAVHGELNKYSF